MSKEITKVEQYSINSMHSTKKMATVLAGYIKDNRLSVDIAGHQYAMVEAWQVAGGLLGLFPKITEVKEIAPLKWMATCEIKNKKTNEVVSTGYAICSKEEYKKKSFDEYAILSMAQTRAIGKAYRNYIGWIIKMAGYSPTPFEEMSHGEFVAQEPVKVLVDVWESKLKKCKSLSEVSSVWSSMPIGAKEQLKGLKDLLKEEFTIKNENN